MLSVWLPENTVSWALWSCRKSRRRFLRLYLLILICALFYGVGAFTLASAAPAELGIILPTAGDGVKQADVGYARSTSKRLTRMLAGIGLAADTIEEAALIKENARGTAPRATGGAGSSRGTGLRSTVQRRLLILPMNAAVSLQTAAYLKDFVASGGKLLVTYSLAEEVAQLLQLRQTQWLREEHPGQFASIHLNAPEVQGMPASVRQASWNITVAEPTAPQTKVIGYWYNAKGENTGLPALLLGESGAFFSHVFLPDDIQRKKLLLAALLGHLVPEFRRAIAKKALDDTSKIGHTQQHEALAKFVERSTNSDAIAALRTGHDLVEQARAAYAREAYNEVISTARAGRAALSKAYFLSHTNVAVEDWRGTGTRTTEQRELEDWRGTGTRTTGKSGVEASRGTGPRTTGKNGVEASRGTGPRTTGQSGLEDLRGTGPRTTGKNGVEDLRGTGPRTTGQSGLREGRAVWNHSGLGAYPGDWERSAKELADAGVNMLIPNMAWAGVAHYPSAFLPPSETFTRYGDQVEQCVQAARQHGLEVHIWKITWNLEDAPKEFIEKMRAAGRTQVSATGEPLNWLCPSHPENVKLELNVLLEIVENYDVDGVQLDYIRYPGAHACYCEECRKRFALATQTEIDDWPASVLPKGISVGETSRSRQVGEISRSRFLRNAYTEWRVQQITRLVRLLHKRARELKPDIKISAAVFGGYPACVTSIGQDWVAWAKAGYLDFVCPMNYTEDTTYFTNLLENQLALLPKGFTIYPGIGATATNSLLTADAVIGQIYLARLLGASGWTIFDYSVDISDTVLPAIRMGIGARPAEPPHFPR